MLRLDSFQCSARLQYGTWSSVSQHPVLETSLCPITAHCKPSKAMDQFLPGPLLLNQHNYGVGGKKYICSAFFSGPTLGCSGEYCHSGHNTRYGSVSNPPKCSNKLIELHKAQCASRVLKTKIDQTRCFAGRRKTCLRIGTFRP